MQMITANKLYVPIMEQNLSKENNEKTQEVLKFLFLMIILNLKF